MTLTHNRGRLLLALVALAAVTVLVVKLASGGDSTGIKLAADDPHAKANVPAAQVKRVLAATETASKSASKAELVSQGRALFENPGLSKSGETCGGGDPPRTPQTKPPPKPPADDRRPGRVS